MARSKQLNQDTDPDKQAKTIFDKISSILGFERWVSYGNKVHNEQIGYVFTYIFLNNLVSLTGICDHVKVIDGRTRSVNHELTNWRFCREALPLLENKAEQAKQQFDMLNREIDEDCRVSGNFEPFYELAQDPLSGTGALRDARMLARPAEKYFKQWQKYYWKLPDIRDGLKNITNKYSFIVSDNQYGLFDDDLQTAHFMDTWIDKPAPLNKMEQCWQVINNNPAQKKLNRMILQYTSADKAHKGLIKAQIFKALHLSNTEERPARPQPQPSVAKKPQSSAYKVCPNCGTKVPQSYNFCIKCGHKF